MRAGVRRLWEVPKRDLEVGGGPVGVVEREVLFVPGGLPAGVVEAMLDRRVEYE